MVVAFGRGAAGQGNQMGLRTLIQLPVPAGLDPVPQRPLQSVLSEATLDVEHRANGHVQGLGHLGPRPPLVGLQQNAGPGGHSGGTPSCPNNMLQLVPLFRRQPDPEFLPDHAATSHQLQLLKDYHYQSTTVAMTQNLA